MLMNSRKTHIKKEDNAHEGLAMLLSKNKEVLDLILRNMKLDEELFSAHETSLVQSEELIKRYDQMQNDLAAQREEIDKSVALLRHLIASVRDSVKLNRNELDEELSGIFKNL